ncbi:MAG: imidazoleglycerol-phosphate dehydratase HisB [Thermodesulfobacteriota bacterium]
MDRAANIKRKTTETEIELELRIDGRGAYKIDTSVPFLDHMLILMTRHGLFDLKIKARGDTDIDFHHTVEDVGICLGEALKKSMGDKKGIKRYGSASVPMMEALASVVMDLSDRPMLVYNVTLPGEKVGGFDGELTEEFLRAFSTHGGINLHVNLLYGSNMHHIIEAVFKALGKALDIATQVDERIKGVLSTKGKL